MRTAIYGGTFNPIHKGHIHLLCEIERQMKFDRVFLIPTNVPPHKEGKEMAPAAERLHMCRSVLRYMDFNASVLDIEIKRSGRSYTSDTLRELSEIYPEDTFFLIMGEDMFLTLDKWVRFKDIIRDAEICAAVRSEDGEERMLKKALEYEKLGAVCHLISVEFLDISSTRVREKIKNGEDTKELLYPETQKIIDEKHLYSEL